MKRRAMALEVQPLAQAEEFTERVEGIHRRFLFFTFLRVHRQFYLVFSRALSLVFHSADAEATDEVLANAKRPCVSGYDSQEATMMEEERPNRCSMRVPSVFVSHASRISGPLKASSGWTRQGGGWVSSGPRF